MNKKNFPIVLFLLCFVFQTSGYCASYRGLISKGNKFYKSGNYDDSLKMYKKAVDKVPLSEIANFNEAAALYKKEQYDQAIDSLSKILGLKSAKLEPEVNYNIGNCKYMKSLKEEDSNLSGAIDLLEESIGYYERTLQLDPKDEDAKHNIDIAKKRLEELKKKLSQQQQSSKEEQSSDKQCQDKQQEQSTSKSDSKNSQAQKQEESESKSNDESKKENQTTQEQSTNNDKTEQKSSDSQNVPNDEGEEKQNASISDFQKQQSDENKDEKQSMSQQQRQEESNSQEGMSEREAVLLLEGYRHEQEKWGKLKPKESKENSSEVSKNW